MSGRQIFVDDKDRRHFLELLEATVGMFNLRLHAFVLLSNHYHLLLEITEVNLAAVDDPALVNREPFAGGWFYKIKLSNPGEAASLLSPEAYKAQIGG